MMKYEILQIFVMLLLIYIMKYELFKFNKKVLIIISYAVLFIIISVFVNIFFTNYFWGIMDDRWYAKIILFLVVPTTSFTIDLFSSKFHNIKNYLIRSVAEVFIITPIWLYLSYIYIIFPCCVSI